MSASVGRRRTPSYSRSHARHIHGHKRACRYLVDALNTVATDVNTVSGNLNEFLDLQAEAVDGLATALSMAHMVGGNKSIPWQTLDLFE